MSTHFTASDAPHVVTPALSDEGPWASAGHVDELPDSEGIPLRAAYAKGSHDGGESLGMPGYEQPSAPEGTALHAAYIAGYYGQAHRGMEATHAND